MPPDVLRDPITGHVGTTRGDAVTKRPPGPFFQFVKPRPGLAVFMLVAAPGPAIGTVGTGISFRWRKKKRGGGGNWTKYAPPFVGPCAHEPCASRGNGPGGTA